MKLKLIIVSALSAVMLSATSAVALVVNVVATDQAARNILDPGQSLDLGGGVFDPVRLSVSGSVSNFWRSPWEGDTNGNAATEFWTVGPTNPTNGPLANTPNPAQLKYTTGKNTFSLLWGSVDSYNKLSFFDSLDNPLGVVVGGDLNMNPVRVGAQLVTISGFGPSAFTRVEFLSDGYNAFEFSNIVAGPASGISAVPVPAALPLFGTGLAIMGFIGWRKKRKAATA